MNIKSRKRFKTNYLVVVFNKRIIIIVVAVVVIVIHLFSFLLSVV